MPNSYRKKILRQVINAGKRLSIPFVLNQEKATKQQSKTLEKLLLKAENTEFGKMYQFSDILASKFLIRQYQQRVPIGDYSTMHEWWQKAYNGKEDVTWPGKIEYFALSSGTSEGSSKYIPVSSDMLKSITKASVRQMISVLKTDIPKDYLAKDYLMMSGSTSLYFNDEGKTYAGDLSGITGSNVPSWFDRFSKPTMDIRNEKDWEKKIERIVEEATNWDVVGIAGVPAWIQILFEKIISRYKVKTIHDVWPNFSFYLWGGVSIDPYKRSLDPLFERPIMYFETYLASEGFVAYQARKEAQGMRLNFKNGMFFEFVPFNEQNFDENGNIKSGAVALNIGQVELNKNYAILLTTCSGAWRYLIGDTIKFVDLEQCEIKITGRTKHYLSLCGEHLGVDNMNFAVSELSYLLNTDINEYTVKGVTENGVHGHTWYLGCDINNPDLDKVQKMLDDLLISVNDDYATERKYALKNLKVHIIQPNLFIEWMQEQGKYGSQSKFPRVLSNDKYQEWIEFLKNKKAI
jgi:hypothetical protein